MANDVALFGANSTSDFVADFTANGITLFGANSTPHANPNAEPLSVANASPYPGAYARADIERRPCGAQQF